MNSDYRISWIVGALLLLVLVVGGAWWYAKQRDVLGQAGAAGLLMGGATDVLKIEDVKIGTGDPAIKGQTVSVHYVGTFQDGVVFDSSRSKNQPFVFTLGTGQVIKGWDDGIVGMKVGGVRKLVVPSEFGYGAAGRGPIPPNTTLYFEVELLGIVDVKG